MRRTDDRVPKVVITEAAPAALAGANTRRKATAPLRLTPLSASPRSARRSRRCRSGSVS
jgi:hypothetical protein